MKRHFSRVRRFTWIGLVVVLLTGGCQATPPAPVEFSDEESVEATVTAVDVAASSVTLRDADGDEQTFFVPGARNLAQVAVGDTLKVSYAVTYRASVAAPGEAASGAALVAERAEEGEMPGGFIAAGSVTTVEIVSVSEDGRSVSFRDEYGQLDSMSVVRDEGQAFARQLKRGDLVVLEFVESVGIEVEKAADR